MGRSTATTQGIRVDVESTFVHERSNPARRHYFFAYRITISNQGDAPAQLMARHWVITDGNGQVEHVRGPGVVGETPRLEPGQSFSYQSYCPLSTPIGSMEGRYQMVRDDGSVFEAEVALFTLEEPLSVN
jgi:ApaG protein